MSDDLSLARPGPGELNLEHGGWRRVSGYSNHDLYVLVDNDAQDGAVRYVIRGLAIMGERITKDDLSYIPLGQLERLANKPEDVNEEQFFKELQPLYRRDGEEAKEFAARVALYYRLFAARDRYPAKAIAEHSRVPVRRVRFWISEARRLGELPKGQQGKVG